jgi:hypothetical protein
VAGHVWDWNDVLHLAGPRHWVGQVSSPSWSLELRELPQSRIFVTQTVRFSGAYSILDTISLESLRVLVEKGWSVLNATKTMFS